MSNETITLNDVRGVSNTHGKEMKLFITPARLTSKIVGQGIFCNIIQPGGFETQLASRIAGFILHEAYISFQNNHFDSSPLYMPPLAAGIDGAYEKTDLSMIKKLGKLFEQGTSGIFHRFNGKKVAYLEIKVISNGREAAIESDWELKSSEYPDKKLNYMHINFKLILLTTV